MESEATREFNYLLWTPAHHRLLQFTHLPLHWNSQQCPTGLPEDHPGLWHVRKSGTDPSRWCSPKQGITLAVSQTFFLMRHWSITSFFYFYWLLSQFRRRTDILTINNCTAIHTHVGKNTYTHREELQANPCWIFFKSPQCQAPCAPQPWQAHASFGSSVESFCRRLINPPFFAI